MRTLALLTFFVVPLAAQEAAAISGQVLDPSGTAVPGAEIRVLDHSRSLVRIATADEQGVFLVNALPPGEYSIEAAKPGFNRFILERILLQPRDRKDVRVDLAIETLANSITVEAVAEGISTDATTGTGVEQDYFRHLPVNGRNPEGVIALAAGVTADAGMGGGINVNGLRSNTNYYTLDGVSLANGQTAGPMLGGMGRGMGPMAGGGGGAPVASGMSDTSLDSLAEIRVQTSTFAPEFGRTPGAQVAMTSRGGANTFHGSLFEYFRNDRLNANDWFANRAGLSRGAMRVNQFGGTLGGRIVRDRTFFFASWESHRLREPETAVVSVPDNATRASAKGAIRPYVLAFPAANGPELEDGAAQYSAVFSNPENRDSASFRLDQAFSQRHLGFIRYNWSPTWNYARSSIFSAPNVINESCGRNHSFTGSLQSMLKPPVSNDLRVNVSRNAMNAFGYMDSFGGAVPLTDSQVFPKGVTSATGSFSLSVLGLSGYSLGHGSGRKQWQTNAVDNLTMTAGRHQYKIGFDYRLSRSENIRKPYSLAATFNGLSGEDGSLLSGAATNSIVASSEVSVWPSYSNLSFYVQDTWRADPGLTLTFGFRWDINPSPTAWRGEQPYALSSAFHNRVTQSERLYDTRWGDISPRFGIAQRIGGKPGREWTLRGGIGIFRDLGYGTTAAAFNGAPYSNVQTYTSEPFPLSAASAAPPPLPPSKPFGQLSAAERSLDSPKVVQWNATVERNFGMGQTVGLGYVGTRGTKLLRTTMQPSFYDDYEILQLATNGAESDYHSMQLQVRRRLGRSLQIQGAYTWSHSIDTASNDLGMGFATIFGAGERGNSDFDIRHNLTLSGSYLLPGPRQRWLACVFKGWSTEWMLSARTGAHFDITGVSSASSEEDEEAEEDTPIRLFAQVRPDYNGLSVWLDDPTAPGGRRLNPDAFRSPEGYAQGNLGRNSIAGFSLIQLDLSIRREIRLSETWRVHFAAQAYNLLNSPSFANPARNEGASMASANFGVSTQTVGGAGFGTSMFRNGRPRSLQLSLRLQF
jgi:hypothetical protein